jgi:hypothetical protein
MIIKGADGEYKATWKLGKDYVHVTYRKIIHPNWLIFRTKYYYSTLIHEEDFSPKRVRDALLIREHYERKCACGG